jgi:radical SAM superfamily enzyme YgiQ (UPF0313 family)
VEQAGTNPLMQETWPYRRQESRLAADATVCLVTALTIEDFLDAELTADVQQRPPQLGVMTLAAIVRTKGFKVNVINLDHLYLQFLDSCKAEAVPAEADMVPAAADDIPFFKVRPPKVFLPFVLQHLEGMSWDAVGLSSICSSYPLTLRLAQEIKRMHPDAPLVLGGPQASVVDVATMKAFPCVDFVVRGEADETFPVLLEMLFARDRGAWEALPGLTFRRYGDVIRNRNAPVVRDLDSLPLPAFDLDPDLKHHSRGVHLEIGRGCPFACSFCSTNDFFRRNFRLKSPAKMLSEMQSIQEDFGSRYFSLVHDMYTVDRKRVVAFCETLLAAKAQFRWGCSARTDCVDEDLLRLMAEAGCAGIFFGIETGSPRLQDVINKKLDLDEARARIEQADRYGITMSVALIIGFPEETCDDLRDTVHFFIDSLRFDAAEPQVSLLAPLAATPIYEQHREQLVFDHIFSDMSHQGWHHDPTDVELIRTYPEIFPNFYAVPTKWVDRSYLKEMRDFLTYAPVRFRWLPIALMQDSGDFLKVFDRWRSWLADKRVDRASDDVGPVLYYAHTNFRSDFLEFVRTCYLEEIVTARTAIETLSRTEDIMAGARNWASQPAERVGPLDNSCVPFPTFARVLDIELDYNELIECLRHRGDLCAVLPRKSTIVFVPKGTGHSERNGTDIVKMQIVQLAPLAAALLSLCDGSKTIGDIAREFSGQARIGNISADKICLFGLMQLRRDGCLGISSTPLAIKAEAGAGAEEWTPVSRSPPAPHQGNTQQPWPVA